MPAIYEAPLARQERVSKLVANKTVQGDFYGTVIVLIFFKPIYAHTPKMALTVFAVMLNFRA